MGKALLFAVKPPHDTGRGIIDSRQSSSWQCCSHAAAIRDVRSGRDRMGDEWLRAPVEYWRAKADELSGRVVHVSAFRSGDRLLARVAWAGDAEETAPKLDAVILPHALMRARWIFERHGLERMTVFLPEGAEWNSGWGDLRDAPQDNVPVASSEPAPRFLGRRRR
jgi:hypothetical protein